MSQCWKCKEECSYLTGSEYALCKQCWDSEYYMMTIEPEEETDIENWDTEAVNPLCPLRKIKVKITKKETKQNGTTLYSTTSMGR